MSAPDEQVEPSYEDISVPASADEFHDEPKVTVSAKMGGGIWLSPWVRNSFFGVIAALVGIVCFAILHNQPAKDQALAANVQPAAAYRNAASAAPVNTSGGASNLDVPTSPSTPLVAGDTPDDAQLNESTNDALAQAANGTSALADTAHHGMAHPNATHAPVASANATLAPLPPLATDPPTGAGSGSSGGAAVPNPGNVSLPSLRGTIAMPARLAARVAEAARGAGGDPESDDLYVGDDNVGQHSAGAPAAAAANPARPEDGAQAAPPGGVLVASEGGDASNPYLQTRRERPLGQFEIWAGTTIPVQLDTGINTTSGKSVVVAHTTEDIYDSKTGQVLVIPKFSRLIGRAAGVSTSGTSRVAVGWDRLVWIDGSYQNLQGASGTDREGNNGLYADVKEPNIIAASLLTGIISGGAQLLAGGGATGNSVQISGGSIVGSSVGGSLAQAGGQIIEKKANEPPELTVPRGQRFSVVLDRTMLLEPWGYDDSAATAGM